MVMEGGKRLASQVTRLDEIRENAAREVALLPPRLRTLSEGVPPYPVDVSEALRRYQDRIASQVTRP
jgi:hypothetical protein